MLKIFRIAMYMFGIVVAGMLFVSCTQGKIPYSTETGDTENTTQDLLPNSELSESGNFRYIVKDNAIVLKKYTGKETAIEVPETIDDIEVRAIDARCFENTAQKNAIHSVKIPSTVSNINIMAFYNSKFLENIECDDNMNYLSENGILYTSDMFSLIAYPENKKESEYNMPNSVNKIYSNAFSFCNHLEKVRLSENLKIIPDYAFAYNSGIRSVIAYGEITHVGFASFCKCENLTEIQFSDTVEYINDKAILFCNNLEKITVSTANPVLEDYAEHIGITCVTTSQQK